MIQNKWLERSFEGFEMMRWGLHGKSWRGFLVDSGLELLNHRIGLQNGSESFWVRTMEALFRPQRVWCKYHEEDVRLRNAYRKKTPGVVNVAIRVLPKVEVLGFLRNPKRGFCSRSSKGYRDRDWNLGCTAFSRTCARGELVASECRGLGPRSCWLRSLSGRIWHRGRPTEEKTELGCTAWEKEPQAGSNEEIRADALPPSSSPSISSCLCRLYKARFMIRLFETYLCHFCQHWFSLEVVHFLLLCRLPLWYFFPPFLRCLSLFQYILTVLS